MFYLRIDLLILLLFFPIYGFFFFSFRHNSSFATLEMRHCYVRALCICVYLYMFNLSYKAGWILHCKDVPGRRESKKLKHFSWRFSYYFLSLMFHTMGRTIHYHHDSWCVGWRLAHLTTVGCTYIKERGVFIPNVRCICLWGFTSIITIWIGHLIIHKRYWVGTPFSRSRIVYYYHMKQSATRVLK